MHRLRILLTALLTVLALALAACGDDDDEGGESASTGTQSSETQPAETEPAEPASQDISKDRSQKPTIPQPSGEPPAELVKEDVVKGDGTTAKDGDNVSVQYVGVNFSNGAEFDASWNRGEPFTFTLGSGQVIPGWDQGVKGMKEGGRRKLVIPPDLGYGEQGSPPAIPPNETLVFDIDLEKVERGS
jgi:peptidylprolyl isomerase